MQTAVVRVLILLTLLLGTVYVTWRWAASINWDAWWIAVPLVLAETYALVDAYLFGLTMWRARRRGEPPPAPPGLTVDVMITTYNEDVDLVERTAAAAVNITYPHRTWILDDGDRPAMAAAATRIGVGYLTRADSWQDRPRHAKAGNLNNALFLTEGEFMLILDADQVPDARILDRTLGWFDDPRVALVQTPQWFTNVDDSDPLGSQAPLFYGPIQEGKDGWNAAFFCGSNAILRREALMHLGIVGYVRAVQRTVSTTLAAAGRILARAARDTEADPTVRAALTTLHEAVRSSRRRLTAGEPAAVITYDFQQKVAEVSRAIVRRDLAAVSADLAEIEGLPVALDTDLGELVLEDRALDRLAARDWSPLGAIESVRRLLDLIDVDRDDEAQPMMPLATVSVTEDMATCMRLHANGWRSVFHREILARGLAPEDLGTMLQQRLRWAQGTLQVMLRENPLVQRGLSIGQRLMYFATMWSYLSGFTAVIFMVAPVLYLCFGVLPVNAYGLTFITLFLPYIVVNQLLFMVIGRGNKTWRGHQYSVALFPLWIRACWTAAANVLLGRQLGFVVTPKTRVGYAGFPFRLVWPQLAAMAVLVVASVTGIVRLATGAADSLIGTGVNLVWVVYDLVVLSVIIEAGRYRGPAEQETRSDEHQQS